MKKIVIPFSIIFLFYLILHGKVFSQEKNSEKLATPSPSITNDVKIDQSIKNLKEKIATKVAEITKKNKKIIAGLLKKTKDKTLQLKKENLDITVSFDELTTKFYQIKSNSLREIEKKDLANENYLLVVGSEFDNLLTADAIYQYQPYFVGSGKITEINKNDYSFAVITPEKETYIFDVETSTKQQIMDIKTYQVQSAGFSKLKVGDAIHFVSYLPDNNSKRASLIRYLLIPQEYFIIPSEKK